MLFGFSISGISRDQFGVLSADSEESAITKVVLQCEVWRGSVRIITPEEALENCKEKIAMLAPVDPD